MNYLEAIKALRTVGEDGRQQTLLLAMSGTADALVLFLRAHAARRGVSLTVHTLAFGTLSQFVYSAPIANGEELFLLLPWDLIPCGDWRTGMPEAELKTEQVLHEAEQLVARLAQRQGARFAYLTAPMLPVFADDRDIAVVETALIGMMHQLKATVLPSEFFSLNSHFSTGSPVGGTQVGQVAEALDRLLQERQAGFGKVLVTDLDNVMWAGLAAEEGADGVLAQPDGAGFPHYLYQSFLKRLKHSGILLVAVSRNEPAIARAPFQTGKLVLTEEDFIAIAASYDAKSAHIRTIAEQLNLGLDAFVFVDDNPVELAEVSAALPMVTCLPFPATTDGLPALLSTLARCFRRVTISQEDRERTLLYRRRMATMPPPVADGADLTTFLCGLQMVLEITDRSQGDRDRAVQLINKTNQFNLNGRRFTDQEIAEILADGGRLLTASLADRMGSHGEILACLISVDAKVLAWVISCRVFQRRVEFAFLVWLAGQPFAPQDFVFQPTEKNLPLRQFVANSAFESRENDTLHFNGKAFITEHASTLDLFRLVETI